MSQNLICGTSKYHIDFFQTEEKVSHALKNSLGQLVQYDKMERVWYCSECLTRARLTQYDHNPFGR